MQPIPQRLWQLAGVLALTHVVLSTAALALQRPPLFSEGTDGIRDSYAEGNITQAFAGGVLGTLAFVLLIPVVVFLSRAYGRTTEGGRWAARSGALCGAGFVVVTVAVGFPAGAAAMYGAQHGLELDTALAINNIRAFAYFLSLTLLGAHALAVAVSALADRSGSRWVTWFGLVTGLALLTSAPLASRDAEEGPVLVWMLWFVGVAVLMIRHREADEASHSSSSAAPGAAVGHA